MTVAFGGSEGFGQLRDETWLYDGGASTRPGHVAFFDFASAGSRGRELIRRLEVRWCGRAESESAPGGASPEFELDVWRERQWLRAPSGATTVRGKSGCVGWSREARTQDELRPFFGGRSRQLRVMATPVHPNGTSVQMGMIETGYVELSVGYRL